MGQTLGEDVEVLSETTPARGSGIVARFSLDTPETPEIPDSPDIPDIPDIPETSGTLEVLALVRWRSEVHRSC